MRFCEELNLSDRVIPVKPAYNVENTFVLLMLQEHWEEGAQREIEISQFTYPVYKAFLEYLYTDEVRLSTEDAIGLLDLANAYCEQQLKRQCETLIKSGITVNNSAMLYATEPHKRQW
jgi:hypothetical protein